MILKASQRGGGQDLAAHLMRTDDNEHVRLHELRGFLSDDLKGAFKEAEAISRGTRCRQYLFSLSLSPPASATVAPEAFEAAIDRIEDRLGLEGQPRAIVFHEKEGRRHAHCVWSRIDPASMTACQLSFFKKKLMAVSRDLHLEHGWAIPKGIAQAGSRDPTNFSLAEWQQAKRQGVDPRWIKETLQQAWGASDGSRAFGRALEERGFFLAKGDKRSFVVLDFNGEVYSLPRQLGLKTKEVAARLGDGADLASVEATQKLISERMTPAIRRHVEESRTRFLKRSGALGQQKTELTQAHRKTRAALDQRLEAEWRAETKARQERVPKGLRGLWHRITGKYQEVRAQNEAEAMRSQERQARERQALIEAQAAQRAALQEKFKALRQEQARQLLELRKDVGRFLSFTKKRDRAAEQQRDLGISRGLRLER